MCETLVVILSVVHHSGCSDCVAQMTFCASYCQSPSTSCQIVE